MNLLQRLLVAPIRLYQRAFSSGGARRCRYYPTCSAYAVEAIRVRGAFRGLFLACWRLLRCNPWSKGGVDFPPGSDMEVPVPPDVCTCSDGDGVMCLKCARSAPTSSPVHPPSSKESAS